MIISEEPIKNQTDDRSFWMGISDSHDTIQNMINELVDDSISSIVSNPVKQKKIVITIEEKPANMGGADYAITVEDSGAGIKDLNACFSFANTSAGESPLNKYGVGFKKVLATLDPENQYWFVETRCEQEYKKGILRRVEAPYRSNGMIAKIVRGGRVERLFMRRWNAHIIPL